MRQGKLWKKEDYNRLGIAYAMFHQFDKAELAFSKAIEMDGSYTCAIANFGNLLYLKGQ